MTSILHRGMYREALRRLRTPALFMLVLATVFDAFPLLMRASRLSYTLLWASSGNFGTLHYSLYTIPFIVVPILTLNAFRYRNRRAASDLYFSLPLSKVTLAATQFAAVLTWTAIIVVGSSLCILLLCLLPVNSLIYALNVGDILLHIGGSLFACFFMAAVCFLASSLCGTTINALFASLLLLFAPRLIAYALNSLVLELTPVLTPQSTTVVLDAFMGNLLYFDHSNPTVWISTLVKTVLILAAALWASDKRPAEIAGRATMHPALHIVFRTLIGTLLSLPAVATILTYKEVAYSTPSTLFLPMVVFYYLIALVCYYLYELIAARKARNLLKATLWLPLLVAVNVAMIGGCMLTTHIINHTTCTPDTVQRFELRAVTLRTYTQNMTSESGYVSDDGSWFDELTVMNEYQKSSFYYRTRQYAESDAPSVSLTSEESRRIVCDALTRSLDYHNGPYSTYNGYALDYLRDEAKQDGSDYVFNIDVVLHDGWLTRSRRIGVTAEELSVLLKELKEQDALPDYFTNILRR